MSHSPRARSRSRSPSPFSPARTPLSPLSTLPPSAVDSSATSFKDMAPGAAPLTFYGLPHIPEGTRTPVETCDPEEYRASNDENIPNWPKGWRPWACLFGCFLLMFDSWGLVNAYGTFASYYSIDHLEGQSQVLLNLVGSTQSFIVLLFAFVAGRLLDAGHARKLIFTGAILVTGGMFALSGVRVGRYGEIWAAQGLTVGLGMACFFVSSSQVAATWFVKRKAVAIGIVACGASIAGVVYPVLIRFLLVKCGFANAVRWFTGLVGLTALLAWLLAVPNPEHIFRKPEKWTKLSVWVDMDAFRNPAFNWFTAGVCFMFFGFYAIFFNFEDWAASKNLAKKVTPQGELRQGRFDTLETYWFLCIINGCSTIGRLASATMAERFGTLNVHAASTLLGSLLVLVLWSLTNDVNTAIAFCVIFGAVSGAVIGLPPASMANILGRSDPLKQAKLGHWTGMMYTISAVFALTGPVIVGYLYGTYHFESYVLQLWCGACLFAASICMMIARCYTGPSRVAMALAKARRFSVTVIEDMTKILTRENSTDKTANEEKV